MKKSSELPFFKPLIKHPFITLGLLCLLVNSLFELGAKYGITAQGIYFVFVLAAGALLYVLGKDAAVSFDKKQAVFLAVFLCLGIAVLAYGFYRKEHAVVAMFLFEVLIALAATVYLKSKVVSNAKTLVLLLFAVSFFCM